MLWSADRSPLAVILLEAKLLAGEKVVDVCSRLTPSLAT